MWTEREKGKEKVEKLNLFYDFPIIFLSFDKSFYKYNVHDPNTALGNKKQNAWKQSQNITTTRFDVVSSKATNYCYWN